jgi:hypothetical protein
VCATGWGARSYNVGSDRAAFGVANNATLNVYELLLAVNKHAVNGVLYNGNAALQAQSAALFEALNEACDIWPAPVHPGRCPGRTKTPF